MADTNLEVRLTAEAGDLRSELRDVEQRLSSLNKAANKAAKGTQQLQAATRGTSRGLGGIGRSAGQASIQVQQLVGQIQGGVNPAVALSQQAADLGFVLGVPLLGAVTAIAAGFAGPFITSLFDAQEAFEDFLDTARQAEVDLKKVAPGLFAQEQQKLIDAVTEAEAALQEQLLAVNEIDADFERAKTRLENFGAAAVGLAGEVDPLTVLENRLTAALEKQGIEIEKARIAVQAAKNEYKAFGEETNFATEKTNKLNEATKKQSSFMAKINKQRFENIVAARDAQIKAEQDATKVAQAEEKKRLAFMQKINRTRFEEIVAARDAQVEAERQRSEMIAANQAKAQRNALEQMRAEQKRFENVIEGGLNTMADGFVGVIRGTNSLANAFSNMANQIINDLLRMAMQKLIVDQIMGAVFGGSSAIATASGFTSVGPAAGAGGASGGGAATFFADGGVARAGRPAIVGERGPELMIPGRTSQIVPNHALGGVNVSQTINISTGVQQTVRAEIAGLLPQIAEASKNAVVDARRRGGSFAGAFGA
jgi:HD-GYP domain-containing protein (c-di-GMP phosphodiesterase class II)